MIKTDLTKEWDILDDRDHLAVNRRDLDVAQPVAHLPLLQEIEKVIQQRAFVQLEDPIDHLTPALGQVLCHCFPCLFRGAPPALECPMAIEESEPAIKPLAYIRISEPLHHFA
jgi:hypothetical protein